MRNPGAARDSTWDFARRAANALCGPGRRIRIVERNAVAPHTVLEIGVWIEGAFDGHSIAGAAGHEA